MAKTMVKCPVCQQEFNRLDNTIASVRYRNRWHHESCYNDRIAKEDKELIDSEERAKLHETICKIFNYTSPGPRIHTQIAKFQKELGYSYDEIKKALEYFYIIQNGDTKKSKGGIGIVPYVMDDALNYFNRLDQKRAIIAAGAKQLQNDITTLQVSKAEKTKIRPMIDLDSI